MCVKKMHTTKFSQDKPLKFPVTHAPFLHLLGKDSNYLEKETDIKHFLPWNTKNIFINTLISSLGTASVTRNVLFLN